MVAMTVRFRQRLLWLALFHCVPTTITFKVCGAETLLMRVMATSLASKFDSCCPLFQICPPNSHLTMGIFLFQKGSDEVKESSLFVILLQIVFIAAKIFKVVSWSWWAVFSPFLLWYVGGFVINFACLVALKLIEHYKEQQR